MAILEKLERAEGFTRLERDIADCILFDPDRVVDMTLAELAADSYSSKASIMRLCRKVGLEGFRQLQTALAAELEHHRAFRDDVDVDRPFAPGEGAASVMGSLSVLLKRAVDDTHAAVPAEDIERAARLLNDAAHIYIYATGDSRISALAFSNLLLKLGIHCIIADEYGEALASANVMGSDDVALFVTYSGKLLGEMSSKRIMKIIKTRGVSSIWISSAPKPEGMDVGLRFPAREGVSGKVATFYSQECIRYLLNCLYGTIFSFDYERNDEVKGDGDDLDLSINFLMSIMS